MSKPIFDAVGQALELGDYVAHVARHGSSVRIKRRQITEIGFQPAPYAFDEDREEAYLCFDGNRSKAMPYNCVRLAYD